MSDDPYSQVPPPPPPMDAAPPPPPGGGYTPPPPPAGGGPISENRQIWLVLSYLWLAAVIPYLVEKDDREVQWHAKHGLVLAGVELILSVVLFVIGLFTCLGCLIQLVAWIPVLILHVMLIVKALNGERMLIPGISQYADQF
jgi:uncharacterized membrane protein